MNQTSKDFPDCFYRVTIKGMCVREGRLLLVQEAQSHGGQKWELPGGGLDFGEAIPDALSREIKEETGLKVTKMSKAPVYVWTSRSENKRGLDWFYSCVMLYRVEFEDLNFFPNSECEAVEFFEASELSSLRMSGQLSPVKEIFNPADFIGQF